MSISEWLNDVVWAAKGSVPISPKWLDKHVGNGKQVNLTLTCPFCDTTTRLSCSNCGNEVLTSEQCGSKFFFNCKADNNQVADFSYHEDTDKDVHEFKGKTLCCTSCGREVPTSLFCEISYASIEDSLRQLYKKAPKEKRALAQGKKIRREKTVTDREKVLNFLSDLMLSPGLILDSNIWMNPGYDPFFKALEDILPQAGRILTLYKPQFEEICNVKRKTRYGSGRNRAARSALDRIERLQLSGLLNIEPLAIDGDDNTSTGPLIIKLIAARTSHGTDVSFLSDDTELRIRARGLMGRSEGAIFVFHGLDFLPMCRDYCIAGTLEFEDADIGKYLMRLSAEEGHGCTSE